MLFTPIRISKLSVWMRLELVFVCLPLSFCLGHLTVHVLRIVPALGVWSHRRAMATILQAADFSFQGRSTHPLNSVGYSMGMNPLTAPECRWGAGGIATRTWYIQRCVYSAGTRHRNLSVIVPVSPYKILYSYVALVPAPSYIWQYKFVHKFAGTLDTAYIQCCCHCEPGTCMG